LGGERTSTDALMANHLPDSSNGVKLHEKVTGSLLSPVVPAPASPVVQQEAHVNGEPERTTEADVAPPIVSDVATDAEQPATKGKDTKDVKDDENLKQLGTELTEVSLDDQV
jgi:hypothetical protein